MPPDVAAVDVTGTTGSGGASLLELENAVVMRDGRAILTVDRFRIAEGEHLAILGPNGAGKSTLIKLLTNEVLPLWADPAPVRFRGQERMPLFEMRRLLGVVTADAQEQADVLLPAREVVLGGFFGALGVPTHVTPTSSQREAAERSLAELGAGHLGERMMSTLSTGEARRVLFARALVHDPAVLVLDEPCAGLDPHAAWHVRQVVRELCASGRSLVLVTHHIEDVVAQIDRVVMLRDGAIVKDGAKRDLMTGEALTALFDVPMTVEERDGEYRIW